MAVTLDIEGSIGDFVDKAKKTLKELEAIADGYEDIQEASRRAVGAAGDDQEKLKSGFAKTGKELKKQKGIIEQLEAHLKRLEKGQAKATNTKQVKAYNVEIAKTRGALGSLKAVGVGSLGAVNAAATASRSVFASLKTTLATTFAPLFAATAVIGGIKALISEVSTFNQTAADLSAITGAQGDDLEYLKQQAVELGVTTTASANDTLQAYKLIASAKPELLDNAAALAEVTRQAVTLSEAAGLDLPTAATNLTDALNQFGAPASEAGKFVNILAAASQKGSAEIPQLTESLLKFGVAAKSSNIGIEESAALIETLAEKGLKGSEAGTALRSVLGKLSAAEVLPPDAVKRLEAAGVNISSLSDKSLTLEQRLRALEPIQNDANALTKVFGEENKVAAQAVLQNIDRYEELRESITGTNVATEQAATRTATISGEFTKLKNTISAIVQGNGDGLGALVAVIIRLAREGLLFLKDRIDDLRPTFEAFSSTVGGLFAAIKNLLPAQAAAGDGMSQWATIVKVANVPLKIFFGLLNFVIRSVTKTIDLFGRLSKGGGFLAKVFTNIRNTTAAMLNAFVNLPLYVEGGLAAIETFITEAQKGLAEFGGNVGTIVKEAFSFGKLIREGTGDLTAAVKTMLSNPFEGAAGKIKESFLKPFEDARLEALRLAAQAASVDLSVSGTGPTDDTTKPDKFVDPDELRKQQAAAAKAALKLEKDIAKARIDALKDGVDKQLALEQVRFDDLKARLEEYNIDSTDAIYQHEINKFNIRQKFAAQQADVDGLSGEERINLLYNQTKAEIDAIEQALKDASGGELVAEQAKQVNFLRKQASEAYLKQIEELQSKEQAKAQQHEINLLELKRSEFDTQKDFEEFKQKEILNIRLAYAEKQLALLEKVGGVESDAALALRGTINQIKGELASIDLSGGAAKAFDIYSLFGLNKDDPQSAEIIKGIEAAASATVGILQEVTAAGVKAAEEKVKLNEEELAQIQTRIGAKEAEVEDERRLNELGHTNDLDNKLAELELLRSQEAAKVQERDKAIKAKQKAQRAQLVLDSVIQASSLVTAAAQIFASVAAIPFVGPVLGAALVAAMIGSFAAAKIKAFGAINTQKAEKGMFGVIKGKRHAQGGEPFVEAEDGEAFGILSRGATAKYADVYEAFTNAANRGDRKGMADVAAMLGSKAPMDPTLALVNQGNEAKVKQQGITLTALVENKDAAERNNLLRQLIEQAAAPQEEITYSDGNEINRIGNNTRVIRRNYD